MSKIKTENIKFGYYENEILKGINFEAESGKIYSIAGPNGSGKSTFLKNILKILRGFLLAPFILYIYNLIALPLNLIIPINIFSIIFVGLLGIPGLVTIIAFLLIT